MAIKYLLLFLIVLISFSCNKLPNENKIRNFRKSSKYSEDPIVFNKKFNGMTLLYCPVQHGMSFSSNHNIIGIYDSNNNLIDEVKIGSISLKLIIWTEKEIILKAVGNNNKEYNEYWLKDKKNIGSFKLSFIY